MAARLRTYSGMIEVHEHRDRFQCRMQPGISALQDQEDHELKSENEDQLNQRLSWMAGTGRSAQGALLAQTI